MVYSYSNLILLRLLIPLVLLLCALCRPVGISFVYLLMFCVSPFVPLPINNKINGSLLAYLIISIALSVLLVLGHIGLQIANLINPLDNNVGSCSFIILLLRHVGFINFGNLSALAIIEWLAPEVIFLLTSVISHVVIKKKNSEVDADKLTSSIEDGEQSNGQQPSKNNFLGFIRIAPAFCLISLFFAASLRPSVPGGFYFLIFLICSTYWATFRDFGRGFAILMRFVMIALIAHVGLIVTYQTPWAQDHFKNDTLIARLLSLEPLVVSECDNDIRIISYNMWFKLDSFLSPVAILIAYQILSLTSNCLMDRKVIFKLSRTKEVNEWTPLVVLKSSERENQPSGSSNREEFNSSNEDISKSTFFGQIFYGIISVGGFIYQNSYIFTNILMMTWSIVYHCWLTFIFLIWGNVLWMIPNQRKAMMRSSPFIVFYAELLLLAQYLYGMNLTNDELPSKVNTTGINLAQIGFEKAIELQIQPIIPLMIKTIFTVMFWITLSQFVKESKERKLKSTTLSDMVKPFQVTARSAAIDFVPKTDGKHSSKFLKKAGDVIKNLLVRLWIWLLILVIFLCAMTGKKMTGFRICYMGLFLFFLLVFQTSSKAWMKIMYGFWLFLIFYAMSILTLVYTYQFDKFDEYWKNYLNVPEELQQDIGLEKYATKDLFLHLVSPTVIVILTVIQVHYFHKRFISSLQTNNSQVQDQSVPSEITVTESPIAVEVVEPIDTMESDLKDDNKSAVSTIKKYTKKSLYLLKTQIENFAINFKEIFWTFLEIHLLKAVYIAAFVCCVTEVCVLHISLAVLCVIGIICNLRLQTCLSRVISFIVSVIILAKMIYQVGYLQHTNYQAICNNETHFPNNETLNTAEWFGLKKTTDTESLVHLIKKYIIYMIIVTIHAIVIIRQNQMRVLKKIDQKSKKDLMFPNVTRKDAEIDLKGLIKYFFNYGFYKFGIEITLITLVSLITFRQDIVALLFAVWLCILIFLRRKDIAKCWSLFQWFTVIIIIIQYVIFVGLPPGLCIVYPWETTTYSIGLQSWGLLPGSFRFNHVKKLFFDFMLLLFINRQKHVFNIEAKYVNIEYEGGSNINAIHEMEVAGHLFVNPTHDFISNVRNWRDIAINAFFCGFFWITLAVVFLAGTYIADLLAIGYLIGSFLFLWQGADFYLRPLRHISIRWKILILYNIVNITLKTFLQIGSCLFMSTLEENTCWLVHILGLSCSQSVLTENTVRDDAICPETQTSSVLVWDAICFAFLIFQLRIFKSHYFLHIINDTKANTILASRGAELIEELRHKQIEHRKKHEQEVLRKIKKKMEKIRATQQKLKPLPSHCDGLDVTVPLALSSNLSSTQGSGYHTPIESSEGNMRIDLGKLLPVSQTNAGTSPSSVAMTVSLDGYLEPKRLSFETSIHDHSKDSVDNISNPSKLKIQSESKNLEEQQLSINLKSDVKHHRRQSSTNTVSWNEPVEIIEHGNDTQRDNIIRKPNKHHALGISYSHDGNSTLPRNLNIDGNSTIPRRRHSNVSWTREDKRPSNLRPYSWGPISNYYYLESLLSDVTSPKSHPESIRSGDYFMFEGIDEKFQLEVIDDEADFLEDHGGISFAEKKLKKKKSLLDVSGEKIEQSKISRKSFSEVEEPSTAVEPEIISEETQDKVSEAESNILFRLLEGFLLATAIKLNKFSRNYRYVMKILSQEKKFLKESKEFERGIRTAATQIWTPFMYLRKQLLKKEDADSEALIEASVADENSTDTFTAIDHHIIIEVLISAWYAILSNTDIICYFVVFLNQVVNASIISLPLPLMVFIWGTLSLPRPTKTFWVTLIAYTQTVVLIKCIFQFKLIWTNYINLPNQPLNPAKIIGIELKQHYANFDLLLLLVLFFHRFILKSQGLWKSEHLDEIILDPNSSVPGDIIKNSPTTSSKTEFGASIGDIQSSLLVLDSSAHIVNEVEEEPNADPKVTLPEITKMTSAKYFSSIKFFFVDLVHRRRLPNDVYALMFLCDFVNFFVLLFGFTAFGAQQGDGGVSTYLQENKVPIPFLIMLLMQFILIVIDRALYLRKALVHKIIFHFISVIGIHIWMFFVIPAITERSFYSNTPPIIFYVIKCIYLLLSSYQIKSNYPKRILGNFLTKGFSIINMIAFRVYMIIPFLYELRTLLDWVCTDTTMTLFDWLKMEDIFSEIYFIKCGRTMEKDFPAMRATKKAMLTKMLLGGTIILIIIIVIWGPLCLFALGNTVGESNTPFEVSAEFRLGRYQPIYHINNKESTFVFDENMMNDLKKTYSKNKTGFTLISDYDETDVAAIVLSTNSAINWDISIPERKSLLNELKNGTTLACRFTYSLTRIKPNKDSPGTITSEIKIEMDENFKGREALTSMLEGNNTNEFVTVFGMLPKFIKVLNSGDILPITQLLPEGITDYRPLKIKLNSDDTRLWWEIKEDCSDGFINGILSTLPYSDCDSIVIYTFNDKKFPSTFSFLTGGGIIGLYTTFVLVASKVLKSMISGNSRKIMFEDLPYVDRILQLCLDIYLVREALEFALEEDLFAKLLFLYRSPETMIKWTRPKEDRIEDDENGSNIEDSFRRRQL